MQRLSTLLIAVLAALGTFSAGCSSTRNPSASDGGTGYGTRPGGGQPSPGTGSGSGSGGGNTDAPATGRHTLSWDGSVLRLRLAGPVFSAWKDGGGEINVNITTWSATFVPFNASDSRKNGLELKREGNDLFGFGAASSDRFNVKYKSPDGTTAWHKYETTDLSGVSLESDSGSTTSKHFLVLTAPVQGIW